MKTRVIGLISLLMSFVGVSQAFAHVRLEPSTTVPGRQTYTMRVPNEKTIPTTKVKLVVPEGVEVTGILPVAGWQHSEKKTAVKHSEEAEAAEADNHKEEEATTRISEITWQGGQIKEGEYMLFGISTNYEGDPGTLTWKAYQTYSDGTVVPWDGSSDEAEAPEVKVLEMTETESMQAKLDALSADAQKSKDEFSADLNTWLAGGALLISITAIMLQLKKPTQKES